MEFVEENENRQNLRLQRRIELEKKEVDGIKQGRQRKKLVKESE